VLARHARGRGVAHQRGAHARELVGGDAHADPVGADEDAARRLAARHALGHRARVVRVVDRSRAGGAHVEHLLAARAELGDQRLLQLHAAVVSPDDY